MSGAGQGKAAVGCFRRVTGLSGQTERPCSLQVTGGGPKETLAGLFVPKTTKTDINKIWYLSSDCEFSYSAVMSMTITLLSHVCETIDGVRICE